MLHDTLKKVLNKAKDKFLQSRDYSFQGSLYLKAGDHIEFFPMPLNMNSDGEKDLINPMLKALISKFPEIDTICFVSEAWIATVNSKEEYERSKHKRVSERDDKQEGLICVAINKQGEQDSMILPFIRHRFGIQFQQDKMDDPGQMKIKSRFFDGIWGNRDDEDTAVN